MQHCRVIARYEAIFSHVMVSKVEPSIFGTRTDPSTNPRKIKKKDCFVVPPRNDEGFASSCILEMREEAEINKKVDAFTST